MKDVDTSQIHGFLINCIFIEKYLCISGPIVQTLVIKINCTHLLISFYHSNKHTKAGVYICVSDTTCMYIDFMFRTFKNTVILLHPGI